MKKFEVTLQNGQALTFQCDDYRIITTDKGTITHVEFYTQNATGTPDKVDFKIIGVVNGAVFSHLTVEEGE